MFFCYRGQDEKTGIAGSRGTAGRYNRYSTRICGYNQGLLTVMRLLRSFWMILYTMVLLRINRPCGCIEKILTWGGINVFWAQVKSLDFVFQHSSLSQEIRTPWNISGQIHWAAQWPTSFHDAAQKPQPELAPLVVSSYGDLSFLVRGEVPFSALRTPFSWWPTSRRQEESVSCIF